MNRSINARFADKKVVVDDRNMVFRQLNICIKLELGMLSHAEGFYTELSNISYTPATPD